MCILNAQCQPVAESEACKSEAGKVKQLEDKIRRQNMYYTD